MDSDKCFLCRKHEGGEAQPPGGYIFQDAEWLICHAPLEKGPLGTLFIESRRHFLDYADFDDGELASFAPVLRIAFRALRVELQPERIYLLSMMEGIQHFHAWIVPREFAESDRGVAFLAKDLTCGRAQAEDLVARLSSSIRAKWSAS